MDKSLLGRTGRTHFIDLAPKPADFAAEVLDGLSAAPKKIAPKFFYDAEGSALFDQICELPEYYPTRTELQLLEDCAADFRALAGEEASVIEFGAGGARKARLLLDALDAPASYAAIEISRTALDGTLNDLADGFPALDLWGVCADFMQPVPAGPDWFGSGKRVCFFPGSTLGNFERKDAIAFLSNARALAGPDGALLLGVDLIKDRTVLNDAYNDAQGVTAAFNGNLLGRMERELDADLDQGHFEHDAFFNEDEARIEMHLRARRDTAISIKGQQFDFARGESIHTESSHKYTRAGIAAMAGEAGWKVAESWTDPKNWFLLNWLTPVTD